MTTRRRDTDKHEAKSAPKRRRDLPYVFAEMPTCECGCVDFDCSGGTRWGKDCKWVYATCLHCGKPAKIIWDFPEGAFRVTDKPESGVE
jgi:hypothetical protein